MKYRCLMLNGPKSGAFFETNEVKEMYRFPVVERLKVLASGLEDMPIPIRYVEYKVAFRSVSADEPMFLYTLDGSTNHFFERDWVFDPRFKGQSLHFMDGVTVHDKKEIVMWVERLRNLAKNPERIFVNECLYIVEEISELLGMRQGDAKP